MRRLVLVVATLATLAAPAPPAAAQPTPHPVVEVRGRNLVYYHHYGNPTLGRAACSAQGELVDTNGNGLADALRGRGACAEVRRVQRLVLYSVRLERLVDGLWRLVAIHGEDAFSPAQPAFVQSYTPTIGFCPTNSGLSRSYRIIASDGLRWSDQTLGHRTTRSHTFTARPLNDDPVCTP
jgi:hypothetical protein